MLKPFLRWIRDMPRSVAGLITRPVRMARYRREDGLRLHLGCGGRRLDGFVNIDVRPTMATDIVMDLDRFGGFSGNVALAFSNAFFEHLYRDRRVPHLRAVHAALADEGVACYIGIPDFEICARTYLEKGPGTVGPVFDLFHVYRYTHGDPEQAPDGWTRQLHKSLFDRDELGRLLAEAGFAEPLIFRYAYPTDDHPVPVNLGFYAPRQPGDAGAMREACRALLAGFDELVAIDTLVFL